MFFPESIHRGFNRRFSNGTLEVKSLKFDGSLGQFQNLDSKENKNLLAAEIVFKQVDWRSPLLPLKKVTGSLKYQHGDGLFKIIKARFEDLPIINLTGTVSSMMNNPVADLSFENELQMGKLNVVLKKAIDGESFENILDDYQDVGGKGLLKVKLQGPLEEREKISITGTLTMKDVSFYDKELNFSFAKLHTNTPIDIPVIVERSLYEGPTVLFTAGIHGDEVNGVEIVRQLVAKGINKPKAGMIICIPIINIFGFLQKLRDFPDGRDLNRSFPGSKKGSLASQVAYKLMNEIIFFFLFLF